MRTTLNLNVNLNRANLLNHVMPAWSFCVGNKRIIDFR